MDRLIDYGKNLKTKARDIGEKASDVRGWELGEEKWSETAPVLQKLFLDAKGPSDAAHQVLLYRCG